MVKLQDRKSKEMGKWLEISTRNTGHLSYLALLLIKDKPEGPNML